MKVLTKQQFNDGRRKFNKFHKKLQEEAIKDLKDRQAINEHHEAEFRAGVL